MYINVQFFYVYGFVLYMTFFLISLICLHDFGISNGNSPSYDEVIHRREHIKSLTRTNIIMKCLVAIIPLVIVGSTMKSEFGLHLTCSKSYPIIDLM